MKALLYFEAEKLISTSGIGRALSHQKQALGLMGINYTTDPKDEDYDILHINTVGPNSASMIKKARKENKAVIYHAHTTEEDFRNSFILSNQIAPFLKRRLIDLYSSADLIITPTPYSKSLIKNYGIDVPILPISNGIDLTRFEYDEDKVTAFRKYFSLSPEDKVVFSVGLYFERKGLLDFFEVAKRLPDYKFIWFGFTAKYLIPKQIREALKVAPPNVILPGYVKGPIIEGAFLAGDVFFFPSFEETEGIVVLEALAGKQNVVVRDIGVYDEWLFDKKNCYMGNSVSEFVRLISDVINHKLPSTREAGYKTALSRSIANVGKELKKAYLSVL